MKRISTSKEQLFEMRLSADLFEERFGPRSKPFEPPFSDWPEDDDEPRPLEGENIEDHGAFRDRPENFADFAKFKEAPKYVDNDRAETLLEDYTGGDGMLVWEGDPRSPDGAYLIDNVSGQTIGYLQGDRFMYNGDWSDGLPVELIGQIAQKLDRPEPSMDMPRRKRTPRPEPKLRDEMEMPPRTTRKRANEGVTIPWDLALEITGKLAGYRSTCDESTALGAQNCQDIDRILGYLKEAMGVGDQPEQDEVYNVEHPGWDNLDTNYSRPGEI